MNRVLLLPISLAIIAVSLVSGLAISQPVLADAISGSGDNSGQQEGMESIAKRWMYYRALVGCYSVQDVGKNSFDEVEAGTWLKRNFNDYRVASGYTDTGGDGIDSCGDGGFITKALQTLGFSSNKEAFCAMSIAKRGSGTCADGSGDYDMSGNTDDQVKAFKSAVSKLSNSSQFPYDGAGTGKILYFVALQTLKSPEFCDAKDVGEYTNSMSNDISNSKKKVVVNVVDTQDGSIKRRVFEMGGNREEDSEQTAVYSQTGTDQGFKTLSVTSVNDKQLTCGELAKLTWSNDQTFSEFVKNYNRANPTDAPSSSTLAGGDSDGSTGEKSSCAIDGIGWIVCTVTEFMADIADGMYGIIAKMFLDVPPINVNTSDPGNAIYKAWTVIRNFANLAFVIVFVIIIYSQLTGAGISNYGIKRILPRLIIGVILMNASYFICAIAVDISNITGSSLQSVLESVRQQSLNAPDIGWKEITAYILSAGAFQLANITAVGGTALAVGLLGESLIIPLLGVLLPLLLGGMLSIFVMLFILLARQVLIVFLVVISPLAFIAFLLPNTEQWFTKWRQWFISLLLLYPIASLLFGVSQLVGRMMIQGSLF